MRTEDFSIIYELSYEWIRVPNLINIAPLPCSPGAEFVLPENETRNDRAGRRRLIPFNFVKAGIKPPFLEALLRRAYRVSRFEQGTAARRE
jgi:hypothetical protein